MCRVYSGHCMHPDNALDTSDHWPRHIHHFQTIMHATKRLLLNSWLMIFALFLGPGHRFTNNLQYRSNQYTVFNLLKGLDSETVA